MASNKKPDSNKILFEKVNDRFLAETALKAGNNNSVKTMAIINAIKLIKTLSPRNWVIKDFFSAPKTFRTPTSAERFEDCAVARFIKLIQAISKVKMAIEARMYK